MEHANTLNSTEALNTQAVRLYKQCVCTTRPRLAGRSAAGAAKRAGGDTVAMRPGDQLWRRCTRHPIIKILNTRPVSVLNPLTLPLLSRAHLIGRPRHASIPYLPSGREKEVSFYHVARLDRQAGLRPQPPPPRAAIKAAPSPGVSLRGPDVTRGAGEADRGAKSSGLGQVCTRAGS